MGIHVSKFVSQSRNLTSFFQSSSMVIAFLSHAIICCVGVVNRISNDRPNFEMASVVCRGAAVVVSRGGPHRWAGLGDGGWTVWFWACQLPFWAGVSCFVYVHSQSGCLLVCVCSGDQAYCEPCYQELYGLICETCQEYITGSVLEVRRRSQ